MRTSMMKYPAAQFLLLMAVTVTLPACRGESEEVPTAAMDAPAAPTNRVDINASVRQNLGITFAQVESRSVSRTLRVPGRFELLPTARREYRAAAPGIVEILVQQYEPVEVGTPLYRIDSPAWRAMQRDLADAEASVRLAQAGVDSIDPLLAAHENHHTEIQKAVDLWVSRVEELEAFQAAGGARADEVAQAKSALASSRSELAETLEKEAELLARKTETAAALDAANARLNALYAAAASLVGVEADELRSAPTGGASKAGWQSVSGIEVRAVAPGMVDSVGVVSGGVIDQHAQVLSVVQPELVRFRAVALQSDLPRLADGQPARVVPAQSATAGAGTSPGADFGGKLMLAPTADPERRTLDLVLTPEPDSAAPAWARAGVSAFLEVVTEGTGRDELAIPLQCVARDGTSVIIFRRDPSDPNKAIRMEADLGVDDGRWVEIKSGVAEGNEIVLDGVYQLMVATSGSITKGGHFHPDGTFHEGDD